jgi:hypothetical protein
MVDRLIPKRTVVLTTALLLSSMADQVMAQHDPSLIGWWRLDESSGTTATDSSGRSNDASLGGSATHTAGLYGGGVYCDGTEAYVAIPGILTPTCTVAFWFKPDWNGTDPSDYRLFDASLGDKYFFIGKGANHADITPQDFGFYFEDAADTDWQGIEIVAAGNITANTWYHVAVTWQFGGGPAILYLNGTEIARGTNLGAFPNLFANPRFGYQTITYIPITHGAAAVLDDIKVFNRVLTAEEIPALMKGAALESASSPSPADGATDVPRDATVSWAPGQYAATHDVYVGTAFADVNTASRTDAKGLLASLAGLWADLLLARRRGQQARRQHDLQRQRVVLHRRALWLSGQAREGHGLQLPGQQHEPGKDHRRLRARQERSARC